MQLLINATFFTQDEFHPQVNALAIDQGHIVAVGSRDEILSISCPDKQITDLAGATVLPGFCDSHIHLGYYSRGLKKIDCYTSTMQECIARVADAAQHTEPGTWILGHGWDHNQWPEGYGNAAMLDQVAPDHPVFLTVKSLHAGWANSRALALAGIDTNTADPPGGRILRNMDGSPNGILLESAYPLVEAVIPNPKPNEMASLLDEAQKKLWQLGITSVHDFDHSLVLQGLQILHQNQALKIRVLKNLHADQAESIKNIGLYPGFGDDKLRLGAIKYFLDGAIGPHTAAVFEPYTGSNSYGELLYTPDELDHIYRCATDLGFAIAMHAIGDHANHLVLNAIETNRQYEKEKSRPPARHRIEHAQILDKADLSRFRELDVIASMQPYHLSMDIHTTDTALSGRGNQSFLFKSLKNLQVPLIFGSDAPVVEPNPFYGLYAAVARKNNNADPAWFPEESLTIEEAIRAYTVSPPFAAGQEHFSGKLAPGNLADLIVLEKNPYGMPIEEVKSCLPIATMVAGEWVYSKLNG